MNSRSIRLFVFVLLLTAVVLVSAITVVVLSAKPANQNKPENPGKPEESLPDDVEAGYKIWIGNGDLDPPEDVVLQPYGDPEIDYLFVEKWDEGLWSPLSPTKGKKPEEEGGAVFIGAVNLAPGEEPEYPGTYDITNQDLANKLNEIGFYPIVNKDVLCLMMVHYEGTFGEGNAKHDVDYWRFTIQWQVDPSEIPNPHVYQLEGETDMGPEPESEYDETTDTWTATFGNVDFKFEVNNSEIGWAPETIWEGQLSFTVEMQRILP